MRKEQLQLLGGLILFLLIIILLSSCKVTEQKATRYLNNHREVAAKYCSENFKPIDSFIYNTDTLTNTVFISVPKVDTFLFCDTLIHGVPAKKFTKECPPSKQTNSTVTIREKHYIRNTAEEERLKIALSNMWMEKQSLIATVEEQKDTISGKNWLIFWLIVALVGAGVYIFWEPLKSLVLRLIIPIKNFIPFK